MIVNRMINHRVWWGELTLCLAAGVIMSVMLGQDANWDLRNYHLYNPYALLHGRLGVDLLPAGMTSNSIPSSMFPITLCQRDRSPRRHE